MCQVEKMDDFRSRLAKWCSENFKDQDQLVFSGLLSVIADRIHTEQDLKAVQNCFECVFKKRKNFSCA